MKAVAVFPGSREVKVIALTGVPGLQAFIDAEIAFDTPLG
jgi:hypothetical protein